MIRRVWRSTAVRLGVLAFVVYNANLRSISSADTFPTRYLPISIVREHNLDLDEFPFLLAHPEWRAPKAPLGAPPYYVQRARGHIMSSYPVLPAVLATPVYVAPVLLGLADDRGAAIGYTRTEIVGTMLSKVAASLAVALSVAVVFAMLRRVTSRGAAWWLTIVYAFATSSWSVSSQGLWQTSMSQPLLALALYCLVRARDDERWAAYAGIPLALAVGCRPPDFLIALVYTIYVAMRHRAQLARFLVFPIALGALIVAYDEYYFGTLTGGYRAMLFGHLSQSRWLGLPGVLISPSRGLLVYSPVLAYALAGWWLALKRRDDALRTATTVAVTIVVLFYAMFTNWYADFSYSYRFLVDLLPALVLLMAPVWPWITATRARTATFAALTAFSIATQIVGAYFYPCGWFVENEPARMWSVRNPEIVACLRAGPVEPDGVRLLRAMARR